MLTVVGNGRSVDITGDIMLLGAAGQVRVYAGVNDVDCNGNGEPDGCDIATGRSQDVNNNGIPDECETLPDLNGDGGVDGDDLALLLAAWGTPDADLNMDGTTDGADLAILLAAWGPVNPVVRCPDAPPGDCCNAHASPGCNDDACCASICEVDPFCCTTTWDAICVNHARDLCGCPPPQGCGEVRAGACCIPGGGGNGSPGCDDLDCCAVICDFVDPYCCETEWDAVCGDWAFQLCDSCIHTACAPDAGPCCEWKFPGTPGCEDPECCGLVCTLDPFCCEVAWDSICAFTAQDNCPICQETP